MIRLELLVLRKNSANANMIPVLQRMPTCGNQYHLVVPKLATYKDTFHFPFAVTNIKSVIGDCLWFWFQVSVLLNAEICEWTSFNSKLKCETFRL